MGGELGSIILIAQMVGGHDFGEQILMSNNLKVQNERSKKKEVQKIIFSNGKT